jgi:hypothetical protein
MVKKLILALVFILGGSLSLKAFDATPPCARDLESHFFDQQYIMEAFDLYRVFQSQWATILTDFSNTAPELPGRIKERAKNLKPNPFQHPFDPTEAKKVFLEAAYDIFREVMVRNYVYDVTTIQGMFAYVQSRQQDTLDRCFAPNLKPQKKSHTTSPGGGW